MARQTENPLVSATADIAQRRALLRPIISDGTACVLEQCKWMWPACNEEGGRAGLN